MDLSHVQKGSRNEMGQDTIKSAGMPSFLRNSGPDPSVADVPRTQTAVRSAFLPYNPFLLTRDASESGFPNPFTRDKIRLCFHRTQLSRHPPIRDMPIRRKRSRHPSQSVLWVVPNLILVAPAPVVGFGLNGPQMYWPACLSIDRKRWRF